MPERDAATNHANWRRLIDGLEPFAPVASFTTNDLRDALGGDISAQFTLGALNLCATRGWVDSIGDGKYRRWKVCSYGVLAGLSDDDIETLDRERAAARSEQSAKRRSERRKQQREASAPPAWKETLTGHLNALTAQDFEKLAVLIVIAEGHKNVIHTRFNGDGGKDIIADYPISRLISQRVLVECKHTTKPQRANVAKGDYDEFCGVISRSPAAHGVLMTNGAFTQPTRELAAANPAITLQGPDEICDLLRDHELLVATRTRPVVAVDADYFDPVAAPDPTGDHPPASAPGDPHALRRALVSVLGDLDAARFLEPTPPPMFSPPRAATSATSLSPRRAPISSSSPRVGRCSLPLGSVSASRPQSASSRPAASGRSATASARTPERPTAVCSSPANGATRPPATPQQASGRYGSSTSMTSANC